MLRLILAYGRSSIHLTFLFPSPISVYGEVYPKRAFKFDEACLSSLACVISFLLSEFSAFSGTKVRIREIPVLDKLQYLHVLLSSVLPVVKQIHHEQCFEVELEKKLRGKVYLGLLVVLWLCMLVFFLCGE